MQTWVACAISVVALGCGKKEPAATTPGSGAMAKPAGGSAVAAVTADAAPAPAEGSGSAAGSAATAATPTNCVPEGLSHFTRVGNDLVVCEIDDAHCWTLDPKSGAVAPHAALHVPGVGFTVDNAKLTKPGCYEDLCWNPPKRDPDNDYSGDRIWVAYHPDGKRVAIMDGDTGTVFDLATKKPIAKFAADLGNSLGGLWFTGKFVADAGYDAGPYAVLVYHDATTGKKVGQFEDFFEGGAGVTSTGALLVAGQDTTTLAVVDGASWKGKTTKRKIPKAPAGCSPQDPGMDSESDDPKVKACVAFANKFYMPYGGATFIDDPAGGFLGFNGNELLTLDKKLAETSRVKVAVCPPAPDGN